MEKNTALRQETIGRLYDKAQPMLLSIFRKAHIPEEDGKDLVQEVFVKLMTLDILLADHLLGLAVTIAYQKRLAAPPCVLPPIAEPAAPARHRGAVRRGVPPAPTSRAAGGRPHDRPRRLDLQPQSFRRQDATRDHTHHGPLAARRGGPALPHTQDGEADVAGSRLLSLLATAVPGHSLDRGNHHLENGKHIIKEKT